MPEATGPLAEIARTASWLAFGLRLIAAMKAPAKYGLSRPEDVLKEVARLRGQTPVSVRDAVVAARFIRQNFPDMLESEGDPPIGVSNVKQLALLGSIKTPEVGELKRLVLEGAITFRELAQRVARIREEAATSGQLSSADVGRIDSVMRSRSFRKSLYLHIASHLDELTEGTDSHIEVAQSLAELPVDFLIYKNQEPAIAVEAKAPRGVVHSRLLVDLLGLCVLVQRRAPEVWLITPASWRRQIEKIEAIATDLRLTGVRFMTFDAEAARTGSAAALQEVLPTGHERLVTLQRLRERRVSE